VLQRSAMTSRMLARSDGACELRFPGEIPAPMNFLFASLLASVSALATNLAAGDFLKLGFTHILPYGLDHVLFVLSLFFCCRGFGELLAQVTLFTVAHSLSLGVAVVSGWRAPSQW